MMNWILNQLPGLVIGGLVFSIISVLMANWIWEKRSKRLTKKDLYKSVVEECIHNVTPMIGSEKAQFLLEAHRSLLISEDFKNFPKEKQDLVRQISTIGTRCNGGSIGRDAVPGMVKGKCEELKCYLENLLGEEKGG